MNQSSLFSSPASRSQDIAIIGMSCRFPGGVNSSAEFYDFLLRAGDGIVPVPPDRWDRDAYYDADRDRKNRMYVNRGGFIQNIDQFDPLFFGISPAEAAKIDPQHRWLLELTYEALENAGLRANQLKGSDTAVYIGQFMHDYEQLQLDPLGKELMDTHSATGPSMTLTANRISYTFDFKGPSITLDTACSSSLVALDLACKTLLNGDSRLAIAGGVNILLRPELTMSICKASMLSPDGKCKSFDASANGYVRSEGAGIILLKRLADAQLDGDPILAVVKASGVNQDGQTLGITVPSGEAQKALLLKSLQRAGWVGADIQYAEAHGTGTAVGDPIEINGLGAVLGAGRPTNDACIIGSVKSNIGHLEATAGVAGVIKTVMAMNHGVIPQNLHLQTINPAINYSDYAIRFAESALPWPDRDGTPRRAVVNSFGFGGTNANVILEQAPTSQNQQEPPELSERPIKLLPISAKTENGVRDQVAKYRAFFAQRDDARKAQKTTLDTLSDVCFTAALKREHHKYRLVVGGTTEEEILGNLEAFWRGETVPGWIAGAAAHEAPSRLCFVYSGMGTQWASMGRRLYEDEPVFREILDRCSDAFQRHTKRSLLKTLFLAGESDINDTCVAQPGIFSIQAALTGLLKSWGIEPSAAVGHSAGEACAAYVAGALSFDDAVCVVYHRSRLQQTTEGTGTMLAVGLTPAALRPYLAGLEEKVSIAAINSEEAITLAGEESALTQIAARLDDAGFFARFLKVGVPYHSAVMNQLRAPLIEALKHINVQAPRIPLYSTVSGKLTQDGDWHPEYWAKNIRQTVLFQAAVQSLIADGVHGFMEIAPHAALSSSIEKNLAQARHKGWVVPTLKRDQNDNAMMAAAMGGLHVKGWPVDWERFVSPGRLVALPNYAWQHASYWSEAPAVQHARLKNLSGRSGFAEPVHPLLGSKLQSNAYFWQNKLDLQDQTYLADHQVENEPVYPAAAYIEMFLTVAKMAGDERLVSLDDIEFKRALFLDREQPTLIETTLNTARDCCVISAMDRQTERWEVYSQVKLSEFYNNLGTHKINILETQERLGRKYNQSEFYAHCHKLGLTYQTAFQAVRAAWYEGEESLVELSLSETLASEEYHLHPSLLDGAFQAVFPLIQSGYLPVKIGALHYYQKPRNHCYCFVRITECTPAELRGDLWLCQSDGTVAVKILDAQLKSTKIQDTQNQSIDSILYEYSWQHLAWPGASVETAARTDGTWLIMPDAQGIAGRLKRELESRAQQVSVVEILPRSASSESGQAPPKCIITNEEFVAQLEPFGASCCGIIYLRAIDSVTHEEQNADDVLNQCQSTTVEPLHFAQALDKIEWGKSPQVYFVTQAAQALDGRDAAVEAVQGAMWGFGRVFASESRSFQTSLLDLPKSIDDGLIKQLAEQILSERHEPEIALRGGERYINRLRALTEMRLHEQTEKVFYPASRTPFQIRPRHTATEVDQFETVMFRLPDLPSHTVEVKVDVAALPYHDLLRFNQRDASEWPASIVGTITAVGEGVTAFARGDRVTGFTLNGLCSMVYVSTGLLVKIPSGLSTEAACALPAAFLPAYFALEFAGALRKGEHVLIHEADEPIGLAAVQLAQLKGAVVHTTSSLPAGRQRLLALGVTTVCDAQDYHWPETILRATEQHRLDMILNASSGQLHEKSLALLKPYGRLIDLSQKPWSASVEHSAKSIAYHRLVFRELVAQRPELCGRFLGEITALFASKKLQPLVLPTYSLDQLAEAVALLKSQGPLQVVAISFARPPALVAAGIAENIIAANRTYLVTGGAGGLGLEVMRWLVAAGAQSIVLLGRSAPNPEAQRAIDAVVAQGVAVNMLAADIAQADDVFRVLRYIETHLTPLAGIIHAAGVLDDGVINQQTSERINRVLAPKIKGAWNLHQLTAGLSLDFFICFSSVAAVVGWAGQSNYAAANAFMDALAHRRRAQGRFALSINWGPWSGSGMAAKLDEREQQRMRDAGMNALTADQALAAMGQLLKYRVAQAGVYSIDWQRLFSGDSVRSHHAVFSDLVGKQDDDNKGNLVDQLIAATADKREAIVAEATSTVLATVLGMKSAELIDRDKSIVDYGVNSLMAMDLRNRLQAVLRMKLPAAFTLKYTTVNAMVGFIIENLSLEKTTVSQNVLYWDPQKPDVVANTEINGRTATLTPFIQFWIHEGHTPHYNVGALLEIDEGLFDLGVLKTALRIMLTHHDAARSQFFEENGKLQQEIVGLDGQGDVVENDFSGLGYELGASRMLECNDALHRSFRFERGSPLFRVAYYKLDDASPHRVCLIFHHYLSDGMSLKSFGRGLIETYFKVLNNQPVELPTKSYSYLEWTRRMHQFAQHEAQAQLPYWLTQIEKSRACFVPDDFESRRERQIDDYKLYAKVIDRIEYSRLAEFWRTQGWEIADLCIYALIKAFSRRTGLERIWIDITTHARSGIFPDVTLPDLFGQVSELATLLFELVPGGTLAEQMAAIRHQRTNVPNGGIGLRALCFLNQTPEVRSQLPQDALPQIGMNIDITDYAEQNKVVGCRFAREPFGNAHGLQLRKKANELRLAFFLNLRLRDGVFSVEIGYYKDRFYHSTIECLALDFCAALLSTLRENGAIGKQENTAMPDSEAMISPIDASHNSVSEPPFVKTNESNPQFADVNK